MDGSKVKDIIDSIFENEALSDDPFRTTHQQKKGTGRRSCVFEVRAPSIVDTPHDFELKSENFNKLRVLFGKLADGQITLFFDTIEDILKTKKASSLALITLIRLGERERVIKLIENTRKPGDLPFSFKGFLNIFLFEYYRFNESDLRRIEKRLLTFDKDIVVTEDDIIDLVRPADEWMPGEAFFYKSLITQVKKAINKVLTAPLNGEESYDITKDKEEVIHFLTNAGFDTKLVAIMEDIDNKLLTATSGFDYKACADGIRSLMDNFDRELRDVVSKKKGIPFSGDSSKHGEAMAFLAKKEINFFSIKHQEYCNKLYGLISDEASHALVTPANYARLFRNIVIEHIYLCLSIFDKYK